jgi:hypothetical protein
VGLSYEEACRIGIGHEHPEHPSRRDERPPSPVTLATSEPKPSRPRTPTTNGFRRAEDCRQASRQSVPRSCFVRERWWSVSWWL